MLVYYTRTNDVYVRETSEMTKRTIHVVLLAALLTGCSTLQNVPQASAPSSAAAAVTSEPRVAAAVTVAPQPASPSTSAEGARSSPPPTPTPAPVASDAPTTSAPQAAPSSEHTITISSPTADALITSPVVVVGDANFWLWEGTLSGAIKDASGTVLGIAPLQVQSPGAPQGGPFNGQIEFDAPLAEQTGTLEVREESAKDGTIVVRQAVPVRLAAAQDGGVQLDAPSFAQDVTLPLHVALRVRPPRTGLVARLVYSNGVVLEQPVTVVTGNDGVGYGVLNLQWNTESAPPTTEPGAATLQIVDTDGAVQTEAALNMLPPSATQPVRVAWRVGDEIVEFEQRVPQTQAIGTAALNALLDGPAAGNAAGAETALPSVQEIVTFAGRDETWGYRVRLLDLVIENGVATANFGQELRAYGGDPARASAIREQIERTLLQFSSVQRVVIQIDGDANALQP